ncbi:hypothetical protein TNCV_425161 [Trichonephila clavipes]|nr:hypothetical protein TNCV_425161 [Trichonephila clavipes]
MPPMAAAAAAALCCDRDCASAGCLDREGPKGSPGDPIWDMDHRVSAAGPKEQKLSPIDPKGAGKANSFIAEIALSPDDVFSGLQILSFLSRKNS